MEKKRAFMIAGVCVTISILLVIAYTKVRRQELTKEFGEELNVVVAAKPIPEYAIIRRDMVDVMPIFKKFIQPQASVVAGESVESALKEIIGKAAYVPIYVNEQITLTKLIHQNGKPVLDRQLERKMRAVTVTIAPHTAVGRLIRPGNRIDVLTTVMYEQSGSQQFETKTIFQNVLVLATGRNVQNSVPTRVDRDVLGNLEGEFEKSKRKDLYSTSVDSSSTSRPDDNFTTLVLQLTPEDAEKLMVIQHTIGDSKLYYTLRNSADLASLTLSTTILDNVLGPDSYFGRSQVKPPPSAPAKPKYIDTEGGVPIPRY